jgi:hypothetical protein
MSHLIARILLSIFVFPLAAIVYLVAFWLWMEAWRSGGYYRERWNGFCLAGGAGWVFMAVYWFFLWRKSVKWTGERIGLTGGAVVLAVVGGAMVGGLTGRMDESFGAFMASITAPMLWLVATVFIWRESGAERAARVVSAEGGRETVVCPTCGYNLTGLKEARCPECGAQFTLDQLLAAQPSRVGAELEK